jgi:hypothetical protein
MSATRPEGGRRDFFRWLTRERAAALRRLRDVPQLSLADLPKLPPPVLASVKPRVLTGVSIVPVEGRVFAELPGGSQPVPLFPMDPATLAIFNRFNGRNSVGQVAEAVCAESRLAPEAAFMAVRAMFLRLTSLGVCVPSNVPSASAPTPPPARETTADA